MRKFLTLTMVCAAVLPVTAVAADDGVVRHELSVELSPSAHSIVVVDRISLGDTVAVGGDRGLRFVLHAGLEPRVLSEGWILEEVEGEVHSDFFGINATTETVESDVPLRGYRLLCSESADPSVEISYGGVINHPLATQGEEYQRSFSETPGLISEDGVFLAGTSFWIPSFGDGLVSFDLTVAGLTPPWDVVSQGRRTEHRVADDGTRITAWSCPHPTEEVYLVAGPWHQYGRQAGEVEVFAFLRQDDPALAGRYLEATERYLKLYEKMLPPFPFASFALVENFWETGYGMPGFTLLGPQVIRFPWILTSSYPHELLHNWWGNSAYVDFEEGNWCEGLTAYMADHLLSEQRGESATYRRATLKKYSDFVSSGNDFPLREFSSRRSAATEAVGYGKSLMLFHMLRRAVGDEAFLEALSRFYEQHRFSRATFADIAAAFAETGDDWQQFFEAWTTRTGAVRLEIGDVSVAAPKAPGSDGWSVSVSLRQAQDGEPFPATVPVAVTVEGSDEAVWAEVPLAGREGSIEIPCDSRPLRLDVDPLFDVMRRLDPLEVPPAMSTLLGADDVVFVLPSRAPEGEIATWRDLATDWAKPEAANIVLDEGLERLPGGSCWVLGADNLFASEVADRLADNGVRVSEATVELAGDSLDRNALSLVLVARSAADPTAAKGWIAADPADAIAGLKRKLPHYSRYSYLAFRGPEPANVAKGMWQPLASPLVRNLSEGDLPALKQAERVPLADLPPAYDAEALLETARVLADPAMGGRGLGSEGLERATAWVERRFAEIGLAGAGEDGFRQSWTWTGGEPEQEMTLTNLLARIPGSDAAFAGQPVLVIAHLDHLGRGWPDVRGGNAGQVHPGADDNASGVAVLLELAKTMAAEARRPRPVLFAVTTGEEAGLLGSRHLLGTLGPSGQPFACVNLDTVGRLGDGKLLVLNADTAREWRFIFMGVGYTTGAPVAVVSESLDASDQVACIEAGVPAVQLFSGPHEDYHRPSDTADKLDGPGMVVVTEAAHEVMAYLAERKDPLTVTIGGRAGQSTGHPGGGHGQARRASLGTMPDFSFQGPGVRVQQVMEGSAAEEAGVLAGDVLVAVGEEPITDLRSYSQILKKHQPGDAVGVTVVRDGQEIRLKAELGSR